MTAAHLPPLGAPLNSDGCMWMLSVPPAECPRLGEWHVIWQGSDTQITDHSLACSEHAAEAAFRFDARQIHERVPACTSSVAVWIPAARTCVLPDADPREALAAAHTPDLVPV